MTHHTRALTKRVRASFTHQAFRHMRDARPNPFCSEMWVSGNTIPIARAIGGMNQYNAPTNPCSAAAALRIEPQIISCAVFDSNIFGNTSKATLGGEYQSMKLSFPVKRDLSAKAGSSSHFIHGY